jgi:hypothetical protein
VLQAASPSARRRPGAAALPQRLRHRARLAPPSSSGPHAAGRLPCQPLPPQALSLPTAAAAPPPLPPRAENQKAKNTGKMRIATALGSHIFEFDTEDDATAVSQLLAGLRAGPAGAGAAAPAGAAGAPGGAGAARAGEPAPAQKEALLRDSPDLRSMYDALVRRGLLSEAEFWAGQRDAAARQHSAAQRPGMSNVMSSLLSAVADGKQNQVAYTLTREAIAAILAEAPAVRRAYLANVPHTMSEERFWSYYCKHQYAQHEKRRRRLQGKRAHDVDDEHAGGCGLGPGPGPGQGPRGSRCLAPAAAGAKGARQPAGCSRAGLCTSPGCTCPGPCRGAGSGLATRSKRTPSSCLPPPASLLPPPASRLAPTSLLPCCPPPPAAMFNEHVSEEDAHVARAKAARVAPEVNLAADDADRYAGGHPGGGELRAAHPAAMREVFAAQDVAQQYNAHAEAALQVRCRCGALWGALWGCHSLWAAIWGVVLIGSSCHQAAGAARPLPPPPRHPCEPLPCPAPRRAPSPPQTQRPRCRCSPLRWPHASGRRLRRRRQPSSSSSSSHSRRAPLPGTRRA